MEDMSRGSEEVIRYEEVKAMQTENNIATYAYNSGGYVTGGIWINWDNPGGFTGSGWLENDPTSPVYGMTGDQITEAINNDGGTLNSIFSKWVTNVDYETRYRWILDNISSTCRYEVTN